jgi:spore maturation protein CgeB
MLRTRLYDLDELDVERVLDGADVVLVHEWSPRFLVREAGRCRQAGGFVLLFHDTHHRAVTAPEELEGYDLSRYDGVLAYGRVLRDLYVERGWAARAWTWHEAADVELFHPLPGEEREGDLVWVGNWGDGERQAELATFLLEPARRLGLAGSVYGVRYPSEAKRAVEEAGLRYGGWVPNFQVPALFARHRVTVHVPRGPYVEALPGIPTIRPFEALACGIPLVSAPWEDVEGLFTAGRDYLLARDGREAEEAIASVLRDPQLARSLSQHGLRTIRERHTCAHRVDELLAICAELGAPVEEAAA